MDKRAIILAELQGFRSVPGIITRAALDSVDWSDEDLGRALHYARLLHEQNEKYEAGEEAGNEAAVEAAYAEYSRLSRALHDELGWITRDVEDQEYHDEWCYNDPLMGGHDYYDELDNPTWPSADY